MKDRKGVSKVIPGLTNWQELELPNLRYLEAEMLRPAIEEIPASDTYEGAISIMEQHLGFLESGMKVVQVNTPLWPMRVLRDSLPHIVEKRRDARERYVTTALDTLNHPYEIWEAMYDDDKVRYTFIGVYSQKYQMLVVVAPWDGRVLWNFMQTEIKSLNKHRCGNLLYKRL